MVQISSSYDVFEVGLAYLWFSSFHAFYYFLTPLLGNFPYSRNIRSSRSWELVTSMILTLRTSTTSTVMSLSLKAVPTSSRRIELDSFYALAVGFIPLLRKGCIPSRGVPSEEAFPLRRYCQQAKMCTQTVAWDSKKGLAIYNSLTSSRFHNTYGHVFLNTLGSHFAIHDNLWILNHQATSPL